MSNNSSSSAPLFTILNPFAQAWVPYSLYPSPNFTFCHQFLTFPPLPATNHYYYYFYNNYPLPNEPVFELYEEKESPTRNLVTSGKVKKSMKRKKGSKGICAAVEETLKTTVMIKNIPNKLRRDFMLAFLDEYCNENGLEYDFFYLPMDFGREDNLGYAFVNFTTTAGAKIFMDLVQNCKWEEIGIQKGCFIRSKKVCEATWARIQGKQRLVKRFQDSVFECDKLDFLPVVFDPPRNGSEPEVPHIVGMLRRWSI